MKEDGRKKKVGKKERGEQTSERVTLRYGEGDKRD
jgi:hypothetical protein